MNQITCCLYMTECTYSRHMPALTPHPLHGPDPSSSPVLSALFKSTLRSSNRSHCDVTTSARAGCLERVAPLGLHLLLTEELLSGFPALTAGREGSVNHLAVERPRPPWPPVGEDLCPLASFPSTAQGRGCGETGLGRSQSSAPTCQQDPHVHTILISFLSCWAPSSAALLTGRDATFSS